MKATPSRAVIGMMLAATVCACDRAPGPASEDDWLHAAAIPLPSTELDSDWLEEDRLAQVVGPARVVALGEIVHRAHEPLAFRNRLFRFLVEEMGFRAIALETDLVQSEVLQAFIDGEDVDIDRLTPRVFSWNFHLFGENRDLLQWMRSFNEGKPPQDRLSIYGFELPGGAGGVEFAHADEAIARLIGHLGGTEPALAEQLERAFAPYVDRYNDRRYSELSAVERAGITSAISDLRAALELGRDELTAESDLEGYERTLRGAATVEQLDRYYRAAYGSLRLPGSGLAQVDPLTIRDRGMWENLEWILTQVGPTQRVLVFTHLVHLQRTRASLDSGWLVPMGVHLNAALRDDVVFIGTVHGEMTDSVAFGEYWSQAGALAQKLAPQGHEVLMLDVRPEPWPAEESEWWTSPQPFDLGWAKPRLEPATAFDVWVYFDRLTPHRSWQ